MSPKKRKRAKQDSESESDTPAVKKTKQKVKTPSKVESKAETDDDDKVYKFDADGKLYEDTTYRSPKKVELKKKKVGIQKGSTSKETPANKPSQTQNKPTKRVFVVPKKRKGQNEDNSDDDGSSSSSSDSSSDGSSSDSDEEEDEGDSGEDDDDADKESVEVDNEDDDEEDEDEEDQPPPKPKKGHKTKNAGASAKRKASSGNKSAKLVKKGKKKGNVGDQSEEQEKKTRKTRWTDSENRRLVDQVKPNFELLTGKFKNVAGKKSKDDCWKFVAAEVNRLTDVGRTVNEVKKKFGYLKAAAKKKNQILRKHSKKTGAGPLPMRDQLDTLDLIILDLIGEEPVTGIPRIVRAPVLPGEEDLLITPKKQEGKASESLKSLKEKVVTPSLTRRKIAYSPDSEDSTDEKKKKHKGSKKKKKKKKKKRYDDDSDDEVSSTTSDTPLKKSYVPKVDQIDLTRSPLSITAKFTPTKTIRTIRIDESLGVTDEAAEESPTKYLSGPEGPQGNIDEFPTGDQLPDLSQNEGFTGAAGGEETTLEDDSSARNKAYMASSEISEIADTKGLLSIKDVARGKTYSAHDLGIITGPSDITYNEMENKVTVKSVPKQETITEPAKVTPSSPKIENEAEVPQYNKVTEYIAAVMETAVDRQNDILGGLADMVSDCFRYMKDKDEMYKEKLLTDTTLKMIIDKQNAIIDVQNERLDEQKKCLETMNCVMKRVSVTHDMMADMSSAVANTLLDIAKEKRSDEQLAALRKSLVVPAPPPPTPIKNPSQTDDLGKTSTPRPNQTLVVPATENKIVSAIEEKNNVEVIHEQLLQHTPTQGPSTADTEPKDPAEMTTTDVTSTATVESQEMREGDVGMSDTREAAEILTTISMQTDGESDNVNGSIVPDEDSATLGDTTEITSTYQQSALEHSYSVPEPPTNSANISQIPATTEPFTEQSRQADSQQGIDKDAEKPKENNQQQTGPIGFNACRQAYLSSTLKWKIDEKFLEQPQKPTIPCTMAQTLSPPNDATTQGMHADKSVDNVIPSTQPPSLDDLSIIVSSTASKTGMSLDARFGVEKHSTATQSPARKSAEETQSNSITQKDIEAITNTEDDKESVSTASEGSSTKGNKRKNRKRATAQRNPPTQSTYGTRSSKKKQN